MLARSPDNPAAFFSAVRAGDLARTRELLRASPALARAHDATCFGATALNHAAGAGNIPLIDLLIDAGADTNQPSDWWAGGFRPLDSSDDATTDHLLSRGARLTPHAAARLGRLRQLTAILDAAPALVHARGGDGQLPLHFAKTPEIAALLLDRGADIDARDIDHASTAAQYAARDRPEVTRYLLTRGATPDLFMACMIDDVAVAESLLPAEPGGASARITPERFPAPGSQALGIYHYTVGTGCTLLHAAASAGATNACRWLLSKGADPAATGGYDDATPLHQAAWNDRVEAARALLDGGAPIDQRSGHMHHNSPLGWAVVAGSDSVVELLLSRGAAILTHIPADAAAGVRGQFRCFHPHLPLARWIRIHDLITSKQARA
jgi:ankyrin repeat protein